MDFETFASFANVTTY